MRRIRFALVGSGWRAAFFARIAREVPEQFELTGTWFHDEGKRAAWVAHFGGKAVDTPEKLLEDAPDFLVVAVAKAALSGMLLRLMDTGVPLLCETPAGMTDEALDALWRRAQETRAPVQFAEQYPDQPIYRAWYTAVREGLIGPVSNMSISAVHGYHAAALIRRFLGTGFERVTLVGSRHFFPVAQTDSRQGRVPDGAEMPERRDRITLVFESGKTAFYDFSPVQYHSFVRTRHFNVQGSRGEIDDFTLRRINECQQPITMELRRRDLGVYHNSSLSHDGLMLGDRYLYQNPFPYTHLNDDEIAIATLLRRMGQMCAGEDVQAYSLADALQDAAIALKMEEAVTHPHTPVVTRRRVWHA